MSYRAQCLSAVLFIRTGRRKTFHSGIPCHTELSLSLSAVLFIRTGRRKTFHSGIPCHTELSLSLSAVLFIRTGRRKTFHSGIPCHTELRVLVYQLSFSLELVGGKHFILVFHVLWSCTASISSHCQPNQKETFHFTIHQAELSCAPVYRHPFDQNCCQQNLFTLVFHVLRCPVTYFYNCINRKTFT